MANPKLKLKAFPALPSAVLLPNGPYCPTHPGNGFTGPGDPALYGVKRPSVAAVSRAGEVDAIAEHNQTNAHTHTHPKTEMNE